MLCHLVRSCRLMSVIMLLVCGSYVEGSTAGDADQATKIDELVSHYQRLGYLNGAVLVAQQGRIIYAKGVGEADMQGHRPKRGRHPLPNL